MVTFETLEPIKCLYSKHVNLTSGLKQLNIRPYIHHRVLKQRIKKLIAERPAINTFICFKILSGI